MTLIGIDPASKKIAIFGVQNGQPFAMTKVVKKSSRDIELTDLRGFMETVLHMFDGKDGDLTLFCEAPVLAGRRNIQSTILIAETVGMILSLGVPTYLVAPSAWKAKTLGAGNGNASKEDVAKWLEAEYKGYSDLCDGDQDLCDAATIYLYGAGVAAYKQSVVSGPPR